MEPHWKQLEILVAKIQQQLAPNAEVIHNAKLPGRHSETTRQIDVLVRQHIGQYEMNVIIDCKDYSEPVDVNGVGEFHSVVNDVGAHRGAMVCPRGFTASAKTLADKLQIDLYSPVDTDPHKWQAKVKLPVLCDFRNAKISFGISCISCGAFKLPEDFYTTNPVFDEKGNSLGTFKEATVSRWNNGELISEPGWHQNIEIFTGLTLIDNGFGQLMKVTLSVGLLVEQRLYIGHLPVARMSGLKNEKTGAIITNAFTMGYLDPNEVERDWKKLRPDEPLPFTPFIKMTGLACWN